MTTCRLPNPWSTARPGSRSACTPGDASGGGDALAGLHGGGAILRQALLSRLTMSSVARPRELARGLYLLRDTRSIEQLSRDDTLGEFVRDRAGFNAVDRTGSLIQHIGIGEGLEPHIISAGALNINSHFVLTSDGVHRNKELFDLVAREAPSPHKLVDRLLLLAELLGGHDNATAVVLPDLMNTDHDRSLKFALSLQFFSPFKEAEIWITEMSDRAERNQIAHPAQRVPEARSPDPAAVAPPEPSLSVRGEGSEPLRTKSRTRKSRKAQKDKKSIPTDQSDQPQAKIEFPKAD